MMAFNLPELSQEEKELIAKAKVLVIDSSSLTRSIISNSLKECGFKSIFKVQNHIEAINQFQNEVYDVVICEWDDNEERITLSLLSTIRGDDRFSNSVLIVVCQAVSTEGLVRAVETDIDGFLPKPFTSEKLVKTVLNAIKNRLNPTSYKKKVLEAKSFIEQKDLNKANAALIEALQLDPKPSQAAYYLGTISIRRGQIKEALDYFDCGLKFRPYHLMCLFGKVFCCKKLQDTTCLYDAYKKILYLYPTHPQALEYILYEAISKDDIDSILDIIKQLKYVTEIPPLVFDFIKINGALIIGLILNAKRDEDVKLVYPIVKTVLENNIDIRIKILNLISRRIFFDFVKVELENLKTCVANNAEQLSKLNIIEIRELFQKQMYQETVLECRRFLNKNKPAEDIYELMIDCLIQLKMQDKALESYNEALKQLKTPDYLIKRFKGLVEPVDKSK